MIVKKYTCCKDEYFRSMESMGIGLVLFKLQRKNKRVSQNYHFFYENGKKPPLDVAVCPKDGTLEYISFFWQDEKVINENKSFDISYNYENILLSDDKLSFDKPSLSYKKEFDSFIYDNNVYIINNGVINSKIDAYYLKDDVWMLFSDANDFVGIEIKNITEEEKKQLQESACI